MVESKRPGATSAQPAARTASLVEEPDAPAALEERTAEVLASDATPRGEAEAPRMVRPDDEVNPEFLAMELAQNRATLEELRALGTAIAEARGWIPHQELGTLAAPHWLRFAALHARHHWAIVRDVLAA